MNAVRFQITPTPADIRSACIRALWASKKFRIYFKMVAMFILIAMFGGNFGGSDSFWGGFGIISLILLLIPFAITLGVNDRRIKCPPETTFYSLSNDDVHIQSEQAEVKLKWDAFSCIQETSKYFFLTLKVGGNLILFKHLIEGSLVDSIREKLQASGVPDQIYTQ